MKHVHHDMIIEWAADTSRVVEILTNEPYFESFSWMPVKYPKWSPTEKYRFKPAEPKFIVVNGVNVPEPVREPLEDGQEFWLASVSNGSPYSYRWDSTFSNKHWLRLGIIHLTREAAQAHIDAMLLPSRTDK